MRRAKGTAQGAGTRQAVTSVAQSRKSFVSLPSPVRGWIENDNLAANQGLGCSVLENFFPTTSSVRVRGGALRKTTVGDPVEGLMTYRSGTSQKLFAATESSIYDVSLFPPVVGQPVWAGQTSGRWSYTQFAIASAEYLVAVNGYDAGVYYDGTAWNPVTTTIVKQVNYVGLTQDFVMGRVVTGGTSGATGTIVGIVPSSATSGRLKLKSVSGGPFVNNETLTGASSGGQANMTGSQADASLITITGVETSALSHVWLHGSRLWFVQGGTTKAWYLDVDQVGGAAVSFDFGGLLSEGGALLFGAAWSSDSGSGFAERNVFVSDQGEILVYEGTNPATPGEFVCVGHYQIGKPISTQTMKAGGDLVISTEDGMVPMSAVVATDRAALSKASITYAIEPAWRLNHGTNVTGLPLSVQKWPAQSMALVGWPHRTETFVVNLITGAWAKWTGLDVQCMALHDGWVYFGGGDGEIYQMEASGYDGTEAYVCRMSWLPLDLGAPGAFKLVTQSRATFRSLVPFEPKLSMAENYGRSFPTAPNARPDSASPALWDVGVWDVAKWDDAPGSESRMTAITQWVSVGASGFAVAPQLQITAGGSRMLDAELLAYDVGYLVGGYVV